MQIGGRPGNSFVGRTYVSLFYISYHLIYKLRLGPFGQEMISCLDPLRRLKQNCTLLYQVRRMEVDGVPGGSCLTDKTGWGS